MIARSAVLTRLPSVALFAALLVLTWTLAAWTWAFLTPRQSQGGLAPSAPVLSKLLAEKAVTFRLFGGMAGQVPGLGLGSVAVASNIGVQGVYSARGGRSGFAVLVVDGRTLSALVGDEFMPGVVLHQVLADRVEVMRGGQIEVARMAAVSMPEAANSAPGMGGAPSLGMTVRKLGPRLYGFSRAELLKTLKRGDQLALLGRFGRHPRGGAVLEQSPGGGLPDQLGLRVGDVVSAINGKSLAGPGDVMRLYEQLIQSERVNVDVLRAGGRMNLSIRVTP
ncbi:MAG: type II secretion system protein N [Pseudomonadota bacterium]|nr:type II secretion system protein N [Pseudomonadota bacterium]MDP1906259.1 type II secretion system protein N [Pseudomonadota bacterium]MDP2353805.1 type II secretion system protein N [Pseudomonadota bacterium]